MKTFLFMLCLFCSTSLVAQQNLVVTSPISTTPGDQNILMGLNAGGNNVSGSANILIGYQQSGFSVTRTLSSTLTNNTFLGFKVGEGHFSGENNTYVGSVSGRAMAVGSDNTFVGYGISATVLYRNGSIQGFKNTIVGSRAGNLGHGSGNVFMGYESGCVGSNIFNERSPRTASYNTLIGFRAGYHSFSGNNNVSIGLLAGYSNRDGSGNVMIGDSAGLMGENVSNNVFIGRSAGKLNYLGSSNVFIGDNTEFLGVVFSSVAIGSNAKVGGNNIVVNSASIGNRALVSVSNAIVLGDTISGIKVGIGTTAPKFPLDVKGIINIRGAGGTLKFSHILNPRFNPNGNDQFLTVNEQGEVTLTKYRLQVNQREEWADQVFEKGYRLAPLAEVEAFIKTHQHLPGMPSATEVVERGVDATQFNAKLLEKVEELTLYMIEFRKENDALKKAVSELKQQNESLHKQMNKLKPSKQ